MDYPEWAPRSLIDLHKDLTRQDRGFTGHDPESIIADTVKNHGSSISNENLENMRRQLYRTMKLSGLPENEKISLLEKLMTDQNMKTVWVSLSRRYKDEFSEPRRFFHFCQMAIAGWRGDQKQTPSERRAFYQEIYDTTAKLASLMSKASAFDHYSVCKLIKDDSIGWLRDTLEIPNCYSAGEEMEISYVKFCLSEMLPSIDDVMTDIAITAKRFRDEVSIVKKPNSQNAGSHYFIRELSGYCRKVYGQPLNEVVAVTTSVVFDFQNCDESYVRKIVKE